VTNIFNSFHSGNQTPFNNKHSVETNNSCFAFTLVIEYHAASKRANEKYNRYEKLKTGNRLIAVTANVRKTRINLLRFSYIFFIDKNMLLVKMCNWDNKGTRGKIKTIKNNTAYPKYIIGKNELLKKTTSFGGHAINNAASPSKT
jgi:hypothetical protein